MMQIAVDMLEGEALEGKIADLEAGRRVPEFEGGTP